MSIKIGTDYSDYKTGFNGATLPQTVKGNTTEKSNSQPEYNSGVIYDKAEQTTDKSSYSINRKNASDRDAIVEQLKADAKQREQQLASIVQRTIADQAEAYGKATGNDIWTLLAGGKVKVSEAERAQAQRDISEDGYYGVKQTSQRLFDFACALAGDDVDKMKEMQKAMEKGFKMATKSWGKKLPGICGETFDAANKLFEDYYRSKDPGSMISE